MNARPSMSVDEVGARVAAVGISGRVSNVTFGHWRKVLATVTGVGGARRWVKMSFHGHGRALLRREAEGYRALAPVLAPHYRLPRFHLVCDDEEHTVALMTEVEGRRLRAWQFPDKPVTLLAGACRSTRFDDWARSLLSPLAGTAEGDRLRESAARISLRATDAELSLGPSHGDFSSWNLLDARRESPPLAILDLEHYSPARPLFYDDWHWLVGTLARRAIRHRLTPLLPARTQWLAGQLWKRVLRTRYAGHRVVPDGDPGHAWKLYLSAYLLEQSARLLEEQALDDRALNGEHACSMRAAMIRLLGDMLDTLGR